MLKKGITFLISAALVAAATAHAESTHFRQTNSIDVVVGAWSEHFDGGSYNEAHDAFGVEWTLESDGRWRTLLAAGSFTNSYGDDAWYAGAAWLTPLFRRNRLGLEVGGHVGVARSASYYDGVAFPYAAPGLSIHLGRLSLNLLAIPPLKDNSTVLSLQLKVSAFDGVGGGR